MAGLIELSIRESPDVGSSPGYHRLVIAIPIYREKQSHSAFLIESPRLLRRSAPRKDTKVRVRVQTDHIIFLSP